MILLSMCLSGHGGEPGAGEVPILGSDEEPGAEATVWLLSQMAESLCPSGEEGSTGKKQQEIAFTRGEWRRRLSRAFVGEERSQTENWEPGELMGYHDG